MTLREISALVSAVLAIVGAIWYIYVAFRGDKVKPVLASWIVLGGTMTLSFATYWTNPNRSLVSNAANAAGVLSTLSILVGCFWLHLRNGGVIRFSVFQKWCLVVSGLIAVFWMTLVWGFRGTGLVPNILTQILMIVGYLVTVEKLWRATRNTESVFTWTCVLLASVTGLYVGIVSSDSLAILYAARATIASATIVWLMCRIELRNRLAIAMW